MIGMHFGGFLGCGFFLIGWLLPIILGFTIVRQDANRIGQPGVLWAVLTIPLGWLAILAYVVVRAIVTQGRQV